VLAVAFILIALGTGLLCLEWGRERSAELWREVQRDADAMRLDRLDDDE
jgi:hypothetical protein